MSPSSTFALGDEEAEVGSQQSESLPYRLHMPGLAADGENLQPPDKFIAPTVFYRGDTGLPRIYLTIDDCWSISSVAEAMDIAERYGARLTFFPVGVNVTSNPAFWGDVVRRGHAVENHTFDHAYLSTLSSAEVLKEMQRQSDAVKLAVGGGYRPLFMRPPAGDGIFNWDPRLPGLAQEMRMKIAMWNSDSNGWKVYPRTDQAAVDWVLSNVFSNFGRGSIVLQHALPVDVLALPAILDAARVRGYECVTLREGIA